MFTRLLTLVLGGSLAVVLHAAEPAPVKLDPVPKPLKSDPSVKVDYDIVYVRAPRVLKSGAGKGTPSAWPEFGTSRENLAANALGRAGVNIKSIAGMLSNAGINLHAVYVIGLDGDPVELALAVDDAKKAKKLLE